MDLSNLAGDPNLEENGKWMELEDSKFLIAAHMNRRHKKALEKLSKKYATAIRKNQDAGKEKMQIEGLVGTVLLDWENVQFKGADLPFSPENAAQMLQIKAFREWVLEQSVTVANFAADEEASATEAVKSGAAVESNLG